MAFNWKTARKREHQMLKIELRLYKDLGDGYNGQRTLRKLEKFKDLNKVG